MLPLKSKKSMASIIVGGMKTPIEDAPNQEQIKDKEDELYDDKVECLKEAFKSMQSGDFEAASQHLLDWKFLADQEEEENSHGYSEKEV